MKTLAILPAVLLLALPARAQDTTAPATPAVTGTTAPGGPVMMSLKLLPGQVRSYKIIVDQDGTMSLAGSGQKMPMAIGMTASAKLFVDRANDDGTWDVRYRIGGMKMTMNGMPFSPPGMPESFTMKGKVNKDGTFVVTDAPKVAGGMGMGMNPGQSFTGVLNNLVYPSRPVSVGDTWTSTVPLPLGADQNANLNVTNKVLSIADVGKDRIVSIQRDVDGPISLSLTQPAPITINGTVKGTGVLKVSVVSGQPLTDSSNNHISMNIVVDNPSGNGEKQNMSMDMDVKSRVESIVTAATPAKKPAAKTPAKKPAKGRK